jgi:hypothetical protein
MGVRASVVFLFLTFFKQLIKNTNSKHISQITCLVAPILLVQPNQAAVPSRLARLACHRGRSAVQVNLMWHPCRIIY